MDAGTWEDEFDNEIEERRVPGQWVLYEDESLNAQERGVQYTQRTFGRFRCSGCKRWWNSAEVHVLFFMNLNRALQQGTVKMRIFRQECKKCSFPKLEKPDISLENIMRITKNLVNRIMQVFYGEKKAKQDLKPEVYSKDMEGPHDKEHCEACKLMICKWQTLATKTQPAVKSSFPLKKPVDKPKTHTIGEQYRSDGITSSYVYPSTATYPDYETDFRTTETYPGYESGFRSTSTYPTYKTERSTACSQPSKKDDPASSLVASLIVGIGALALWYFKR